MGDVNRKQICRDSVKRCIKCTVFFCHCLHRLLFSTLCLCLVLISSLNRLITSKNSLKEKGFLENCCKNRHELDDRPGLLNVKSKLNHPSIDSNRFSIPHAWGKQFLSLSVSNSVSSVSAPGMEMFWRWIVRSNPCSFSFCDKLED